MGLFGGGNSKSSSSNTATDKRLVTGENSTGYSLDNTAFGQNALNIRASGKNSKVMVTNTDFGSVQGALTLANNANVMAYDSAKNIAENSFNFVGASLGELFDLTKDTLNKADAMAKANYDTVDHILSTQSESIQNARDIASQGNDAVLTLSQSISRNLVTLGTLAAVAFLAYRVWGK